jgi:hypothetical protein
MPAPLRASESLAVPRGIALAATRRFRTNSYRFIHFISGRHYANIEKSPSGL